MIHSQPEKDKPLKLRADTQLAAPGALRIRQAAATPDRGAPISERDAVAVDAGAVEGMNRAGAFALAMTAVAVVTSVGWIMERRQRLAERVAAPPDPSLSELPLVVATIAATTSGRRPRFGTKGQKKLIELLLGLRSMAGAGGILAGTGIVVFWLIDSIDPVGREPGLNFGLFGLLVASWLAFWGFGYAADSLHRATFNRRHPKFDK